MLQAQDITVAFKGRTILDRVSLDVQPGKVLAVLGPNGAGKTTLLRVISGEMPPQSGQVLMNGQPLARWTLADQARVRAVMPHHTTPAFPFTGAELVLLGRLPHQGARANPRDWQVVHAALDMADALPLAERPLPELSAGERQRLALARALVQIWEPQPDLGARYLLLDEPTSNLDLRHQQSLLSRARSVAAESVGVVAVMHDLNLAAQFADEMVLLHRGRLAFRGTPSQVLTAEAVATVYGVQAAIVNHPENGLPVVLPLQGSGSSAGL